MERFENDEIEIDLGSLIRALLQKWWMFVAGGVIAGLIAIIVTLVLLTPQYESKSMLYILSKTTSVTSFADLQLSSGLTADFEVIATSMPVIDGAIEKIQEEDGITLTRKEIQEMISVSNTSDTRILVITAQDADPTRACIVANAVASETADQMAYIMKSDPPTTVEEAEVSVEPISPSVTKNTVIGILAGILLVGLYLVIQFIRNDNIKTQEDVEKYLGLSTLAVIPLEKGKPDKRKELKEMKKEHEK
ncbi:Wzz/FepE/Etk N-terminal domain-containing protein [Ruminococcus sp. OA3]|uniref:YveK family protein n=1 Tax=Ruminococcus sp. OA3 TaxID=2914164 RepID=UPI001F058ACA|nr:Wzz/FepE/Etk N-terminal domain-containing protein [Ruminococcus sp. OA3]MCH1982960.1 Wzz/FepE/Etk N-terminal domain-containing protein [Ruminococcus sp. OA3]